MMSSLADSGCRKAMQGRKVIIAGAGLMGRLIAWRCARMGAQVRVFDSASEAQPTSAAHTAAAMIAPFSERPLCDSQVFNLGCQSLNLWPELLELLSQDSAIAVRYLQAGSLLVSHPADSAESEQFAAQLDHHQRQQPQVYKDAVRHLNKADIATLEPHLANHFQTGFWMQHEAQVDNRALLRALREAAEHYGARFVFESPIHVNDNSWFCQDELLFADDYFDCRGIGAKKDIEGLRGVRGETIWVTCPEVDISRPVRLLHPQYHLYLVPRGDGVYQLGATEIESEDRSAVSVRSAMEMFSALWCLAPALAEARIIALESNLRPACLDHKPLIQKDGKVIRINGLFRHGYLLAPALLNILETEFNFELGVAQSKSLLLGGHSYFAEAAVCRTC
ncbi:FAD-dependent oxidoreductase [Thalassolituus oleivorans]|uniref:FAD-dependent oxidoreductase n=1 Tax=Thalassolituus oleivorans TaxID=187493 RepID=UPI00240A6ED9|nr:FAD-dependent oxidoreductase [Thalassolituus oleivorans]MDF1640598.1 FAD-dependent oxidoreductase [Thalassolituus oleivorans]